MRLTDEERRIADDVAMHWAYTLDRLDDAWARALEHIAARRKAFGDDPQVSPEKPVSLRSETPVTATAAGVGGDEIRLGDYVLATTRDTAYGYERCVVGFVSRCDTLIFDNHAACRYVVSDDGGRVFNAHRLEKITPDERSRLLSDRNESESPYDYLARIRGEKASTPATAAGVAAPGAAAQAPPTFEDELADLINRHGIDSQHNTPDSVLSRFVMRALEAHRLAAEHRSTELPSVVAAPTAEASDEVVAWYIEGGANDRDLPRTWDTRKQADFMAEHIGGTVVPLVRQGSPRGVVVTDAQRGALALALTLREAYSSDWGRGVLFELYSLLAAIDAAKGGGA